MATLPKQLGHKHFPGMGEEYEIGLVNVGVTAVDCTVAANDASSVLAANVVLGPPNTASGVKACGPIVHSLGVTPTAVFLQPRKSVPSGGMTAVFITADNSAGYFSVVSASNDAKGYAVRMIAIR